MALFRLLALASVVALANGGPVQPADLTLPSSAAAHQKDVVDLFVTSYKAYKSVSFRVQLMMVLTRSVGNMLGVMTICFRSLSRIRMI